MKKVLFSLIMLVVVCTIGAQKEPKMFDADRFQAALEQFITTEAALSPAEAEVFFPLYREYIRKQHALSKDMHMRNRYKPATDKECREAIEYSDDIEIEIKELQKEYHRKFMKVLPAGKVYDILRAEGKFHRQSFKEAKDDRRR